MYEFYMNLPSSYLGVYVLIPDATAVYGTAVYGTDVYSQGTDGAFYINLP